LAAYLAYVLVPHIGYWPALLVAPVLTARSLRRRALHDPRVYGRDPGYSLLLTFAWPSSSRTSRATSGARATAALPGPDVLQQPVSEDLFFIHLLPAGHGRRGDHRHSPGCSRS